jgi:hypothetical protein
MHLFMLFIGKYKMDINPKHKRRSKEKVNREVVNIHLLNEWLVSFKWADKGDEIYPTLSSLRW